MSGARRRSAQDELERIANDIVACERCPRLRAYCEAVAREKRRSFAAEEYWGKPVPGFGDPAAKIWILGLAPAAHGGNRTGRVFTGDRSGDFLYAALHRAGYANQKESVSRTDGLRLKDVFVSAAARCAPPGNKPLPVELDNCSSYLDAEARALTEARVILSLGAIAWNAALALLTRRGVVLPRPRPRFAHGAIEELGGFALLGCYHVSQQNTFTGRLTPEMLDAILVLAARRAGATRTPFSRRRR